MKQKLLSLPGILFLALIITFASCSKEGPAGATGPAGPAGPQGPGGPAGTNGLPGAPGTVGTANVIYSEWLDVEYQPFYTDSSAWIGEIEAPRLVDSILNRGTIKVYLNLGTDSTNDRFVVTLPLTDVLLTGYIINPFFGNQLITLLANDDASSFTDNFGNKSWQYRYVLIPGGTAAGRGANSRDGISSVNWNDYKQVKAFLKLKD